MSFFWKRRVQNNWSSLRIENGALKWNCSMYSFYSCKSIWLNRIAVKVIIIWKTAYNVYLPNTSEVFFTYIFLVYIRSALEAINCVLSVSLYRYMYLPIPISPKFLFGIYLRSSWSHIEDSYKLHWFVASNRNFFYLYCITVTWQIWMNSPPKESW